MKRVNILLLLLITACASENQVSLLYSNSEFQFYYDKIIEGDYTAIAISDNQISSNYDSPDKISTNLEIRFGINGLDNEFPKGISHKIIVDQTTKSSLTDTIVFGQKYVNDYDTKQISYFKKGAKVRFFLDFRNVIKDFNALGYYILNTDDTIFQSEFKTITIGGGTKPLNWDFTNEKFQMIDKNKNGIYEIELTFNPVRDEAEGGKKEWRLNSDIKNYPQYSSDQTLSNAIYNLSLEELVENTSKDSLLFSSQDRTKLNTRDISYSSFLSLAIINPELVIKNLKLRVKNGNILQDPGTGGSWPISSDRVVWAIAAWEVYKVTGDIEWLDYAYNIVKNSLEDDLKTIYDSETSLFTGEQSFLNWQEQSYPRWMEAVDIYNSKSLSTNVLHAQAYYVLSEMSDELGRYDSEKYLTISDNVKQSINTYLWMSNKGYYAEYLYGRNYFVRSPRPEILGESLSILFNVPNSAQKRQIIENVEVLDYGTACFYPQILNIPAYHNNTIWPFINSFYTWAAAKTNNASAVKYGLATTWRQSAFFLTNKQNLEAQSGSYKGTQSNKDAYITSIAGNLALFYRVLFGMNFKTDALELTPFIPAEYEGERTLTNFKYRDAVLTISIEGYGAYISRFLIDGIEHENAIIPSNLKGKHHIQIQMNNEENDNTKFNLVMNQYALETPQIERTTTGFAWKRNENADKYAIFRNGKFITTTQDTTLSIQNTEIYREFQVSAISNGIESFLSEPFVFASSFSYSFLQAEEYANAEIINANTEFERKADYIEISKNKNKNIKFKFISEQSGSHLASFRYSNSSYNESSNDQCAIRSLYVNMKYVGSIVMPIRQTNSWGFTNSLPIYLKKGVNTIELRYDNFNENMNGDINKALLDQLIIINLNQNSNIYE